MSGIEYPSGFCHATHSRKPICGVLAVAICAEVDYELALAACKANMPSHAKRFGGRTWCEQQRAALTSLGCTFAFNTVPFNMTLRRFVDEASSWGITYLVRVRGHVVTVRDRQVVDQYQTCDVTDHRSACKNVLSVTRIISTSPKRLTA